jgi:hypothetical protein
MYGIPSETHWKYTGNVDLPVRRTYGGSVIRCQHIWIGQAQSLCIVRKESTIWLQMRKPFAVPTQFPRESSEARPILQTLGVIYAI